MSAFTDAAGRTFLLKLDGLTIGELRQAHGIDLADVTGETYAKLYADPAALTQAVCFLCREQLATGGLTDRQLAVHLTGEALGQAWEALWRAAKVFFPPKLWSALEPACNQRIAMAEQWAAMKPVLSLMNEPDLTPGMRETIASQIAASIASQTSAASGSAIGPAASPPQPAYVSLGSLDSTPAA